MVPPPNLRSASCDLEIWPQVDRFMHLTLRPFVQICSIISSFIFEISCSHNQCGLRVRPTWYAPNLLQPWSLIVRPWNWCKSHLRWGTVLQNLGTLGLCVLELFIMYATNGQMDEQKQRSNRRRPVSWPLTAWMRTLFRGWSIIVNDTHTRRRRLPDAKGWQFHALAYGSLVPICSKTGSFVCKIEFTRLVTYKWMDRQTNQYKTLCTPPAGQSLGC